MATSPALLPEMATYLVISPLYPHDLYRLITPIPVPGIKRPGTPRCQIFFLD